MDALSRWPSYDQGEEDNEGVVVLSKHLFVWTAHTITYEPEEPPLQDEAILCPWIQTHNLKKVKGEWWKGTKKVVTQGTEEKWKILQAYHDLPTYGHPGISQTFGLVSRYYWGPNLKQDVYDYVKGCAQCQQNKVNTHAGKAPLNPITPEAEALPFQTIALDFIVKLPKSEGYDSILTITNHDCTKMMIAIPCKETISAEGVADLYLWQVFPRFGLPSKVISDRDPKFTSQFMKELCCLIGIKQNISTAYHPQMDRQSEQSNQWIEQYLRFWVDHQQQNWHHYLPLAEFTHNSWTNEMTKHTPFELLMGHNPRAEIFNVVSSMPTVALRINLWKQAWKWANKLMIRAQSRCWKVKDKKLEFKIGDKVWLEGRNLKTDWPSIKLVAKRYGPFKISKALSPITYQLQLPLSWKNHNVFHINLLTPYNETKMHGPNYNEPPPNLIDGEEEYEVEAILGSRCYGRGRKLQYLVKWKGYSEAENWWINAKDVHADQLLEQFQQTLSRRINTPPVHCKWAISTPMSDNGTTVTVQELQVISFEAVSEGGLERQEALATQEVFMSWRPTCPSSWRTPSESSNSSEEWHLDDGSPTLRHSLAIPQLLIPTQERYQSLYAGGMPGQLLQPLIPRDNKVDNPKPCKPQYCPIPDSPTSSNQPDNLRPLEEGESLQLSRLVHSTDSSPVPFSTTNHCIQVRDTIDPLSQSMALRVLPGCSQRPHPPQWRPLHS